MVQFCATTANKRQSPAHFYFDVVTDKGSGFLDAVDGRIYNAFHDKCLCPLSGFCETAVDH